MHLASEPLHRRGGRKKGHLIIVPQSQTIPYLRDSLGISIAPPPCPLSLPPQNLVEYQCIYQQAAPHASNVPQHDVSFAALNIRRDTYTRGRIKRHIYILTDFTSSTAFAGAVLSPSSRTIFFTLWLYCRRAVDNILYYSAAYGVFICATIINICDINIIMS